MQIAIMAAMSRLFILLLIALLPLRGWTVQRMDVHMGVLSVSQHTQAVQADMPKDCALHMQADAQTPADGHGPEHSGCQNCQLCMPLVALDSPASMATSAQSHLLPPALGGAFISADAVRYAKPPIS